MSEPAPAIPLDYGALSKPQGTSLALYALLMLGIFACSTSVLFLKACTSPPMIVAGMRLLIAAVLLSPVMVRDTRRAGGFSGKRLAKSIPAAVMLAVHFILWATGARMTDAANASLIVNLSPIALPFMMWVFNGERINRGEVIGTTIAMTGVLALMGQGYRLRDGSMWGDIVCFVAMILFCIYLSLGRRAGRGHGLWVYIVPVYAMAGVMCLVAAVIARVPGPTLTSRELWMWLGLALFPTIVGHSALNYCVKHLRGQTISTLNLSQFVYAGVLAYFIFGEVPSPKLYVMAVVIAVGVVVVIRSSPVVPPEPD